MWESPKTVGKASRSKRLEMGQENVPGGTPGIFHAWKNAGARGLSLTLLSDMSFSP